MRVQVEVVCSPHPWKEIESALRAAGERLALTADSVFVRMDPTAPRVATLEFESRRAAQSKVVDEIVATVKNSTFFYEDITVRFPQEKAARKALPARRGAMGKYDPLRRFLKNAAPDLTESTLSFAQIEQILGDALPDSARRHRAWWSNPRSPSDHAYAQAWLASGWKVDAVDPDREWVCFRRSF